MFNTMINRGNAGLRLVQFFKEEFPSYSLSNSEAVKLVKEFENQYYSLVCKPICYNGNAITLFCFVLKNISKTNNSLPENVKSEIYNLFNDFVEDIDLTFKNSNTNNILVGGINISLEDIGVLKKIQYMS